jgi:hypothetical protein
MNISVKRYCKGGLVAVFSIVVPVLRVFVPDSSPLAGYLFPPLGDSQRLLLTLTVAILLSITCVVFVYCQAVKKAPLKAFLALIGGMVLGSGALIPLYNSFVRRVEIPSVKEEVFVSIGYQRTDFAVQTYPEGKWTDWDLLRDRGPWEEQIHKLWTPHSINVVRLSLWVSYLTTLACFIAIVSLAAYQHLLVQTSG